MSSLPHNTNKRDNGETNSTLQMLTMDLAGDDRVLRAPSSNSRDGLLRPSQSNTRTTDSGINGPLETPETAPPTASSWLPRRVLGRVFGTQRKVDRETALDAATSTTTLSSSILPESSLDNTTDCEEPPEGYKSLDEEKKSNYERPKHDHRLSDPLASPEAVQDQLLPRSTFGGRSSPTRPTFRRSFLDGLGNSGAASTEEFGSTNVTEDALRSDCSLFFRSDDETNGNSDALGGRNDRSHSARKSRRGFRTLRQHEHQHAFSYKDAVDVLAPTFLNQYKTRYEQLNQDMVPLKQDDGLHSLLLEEGECTVTTACSNNRAGIVRTDTAIHSSLFYQHHGRLLMRLPMDQVRLFMDPDLEPGVLSVEQCRPPESDEQHIHPDRGSISTKEVAGTAKLEATASADLPRLRYVLTVHGDLYQRIVSEMSDGLTKPYCGLSRCCHDNEKVDIRIAIAILTVMLLILFINVFFWGATS